MSTKLLTYEQKRAEFERKILAEIEREKQTHTFFILEECNHHLDVTHEYEYKHGVPFFNFIGSLWYCRFCGKNQHIKEIINP